MSQAYEDAFAAATQLQLVTAACPLFVEYVEAGVTGGAELLRVSHEYLAPLQEAGVDTLVLGCTHYPLLTGVLSYVMGDDVTWSAVPRRPPRTCTGCWSPRTCCDPRCAAPVHRFVATGDPEPFAATRPPVPRP